MYDFLYIQIILFFSVYLSFKIIQSIIFLMKKYLFLSICSLYTFMAMAQQTPIVLFPDGAPGETRKLTQKDDLSG
ncbi:MAG TPA: hypothetical protein DEG28_05740, partial [Porphyromonadaceae bacterium]|nr:hypothetical protein [Porphyromonadaceae bacterium]